MQLDTPVGQTRHGRIMGDHDNGAALLVEFAKQAKTISSFCASRLPVGSSASTMAGSLISARAMHTRCCSPPERCAGMWWARSFNPTRRKASSASASSVMLWKYCANITFSSAVR